MNMIKGNFGIKVSTLNFPGLSRGSTLTNLRLVLHAVTLMFSEQYSLAHCGQE